MEYRRVVSGRSPERHISQIYRYRFALRNRQISLYIAISIKEPSFSLMSSAAAAGVQWTPNLQRVCMRVDIVMLINF